MPKITAEEGVEFTTLPADLVITVRVDSTKVETVPGKGTNDDWDKLDFKFTIAQVANPAYKEAEGQNIWGGVSFKLTDSPDNKLKQWTEALLGIEVTQGFELDTDMFEGRTVRAVVENYTKRSGITAHKVGALLPLGDGSAPVQNNPAVAAAAAAFGAAPAPAPAPTYSDVPF